MAMMSDFVSNDSFSQNPLVLTSISWNLYDNPCYSRYSHRKVFKSFWDLTGCELDMDSDLGQARAQILELKAELEMECKARKKAESACRKLLKEVCKERKGHEELSRDYEKLAMEVEITKSEMERLIVELEDERKMMKMVEGMREERVQMKLTEAKLLYEEKYKKLLHTPASMHKLESTEYGLASAAGSKISPSSSGYKCSSKISIFASAESGNPHIQQGIKGFVEFQKAVRVMGTKNKLLGTRLESQRAQICILLKQKSPMKSSKLIPN